MQRETEEKMNELDRYRIQQVQPWLERVNICARAYKRALLLVEQLERIADAAGGIDYTREHVSGSSMADRLTDAMDGLILARDAAETSRLEYLGELNAAAARLRRLDHETQSVLMACYFEGAESVSEAFKHLNEQRARIGIEQYHGSSIYRRHREALLAAYEVIPTEWRDPRPSAI